MKAAVDLHIHSALSACADNDMTPNNIVNMAVLKGLDIIAVTDHNSAENVKAVMNCADGSQLIVVPGMEVETREEVHLICLFPSVENALKMQETLYSLLPKRENREDIFGQQLIMDECDKIIAHNGRLLLTAADISVEESCNTVKSLGGIVIPAHIDREAYSIISNLGLIPQDLNLKYLEISRNCELNEYRRQNQKVSDYCFLKSSDAHRLGDILERESFIELQELTINCLIGKLKL